MNLLIYFTKYIIIYIITQFSLNLIKKIIAKSKMEIEEKTKNKREEKVIIKETSKNRNVIKIIKIKKKSYIKKLVNKLRDNS